MGDETPASEDFDWDLQSSKLRSGNKIPIPEGFRDLVCIDSGNERATWWGYDKETGYAFLSSGYMNGDRYLTVNNRSYKLEKGSRVTIPKPENEEITEGVLNGQADEGDTVYFYMDSRMKSGNPQTAVILSDSQFRSIIANPRIALNIQEDETGEDDSGSGPFFSLSGDKSDLSARLKLYILSASADELIGKLRGSEDVDRGLMRSIPVPE